MTGELIGADSVKLFHNRVDRRAQVDGQVDAQVYRSLTMTAVNLTAVS